MTPEDQLHSWKEIAAYLDRDVRTVQRWEKEEGLPAHRHLHDKLGSIYAFKSELDVWKLGRRVPPGGEEDGKEPEVAEARPASRWAAFFKSGLVPAFITGAAVVWIAVWVVGSRYGFPRQPKKAPSFTRINTLLGDPGEARFTPGGETVVFAITSVDGKRRELYLARPGIVGSRPAGIPANAEILSVSRNGELALARHEPGRSDILAVVSLAGGAPKDLVEGISDADYGPDGTSLAAAVLRSGKFHLEFPLGKVLLSQDTRIWAVAVSPEGDRLAVLREEDPKDPIEGFLKCRLDVVDRKGRVHPVSREIQVKPGKVLWMPGGKEILVSRWQAGLHETELVALDMAGRSRILARIPGLLVRLWDITADGRVLANLWNWSTELEWQPAGEPRSRRFRGLGMGGFTGLSSDGRKALYCELESSPDGTRKIVTYLLDATHPEPIQIWEGTGAGFSDDGRWVIGQKTKGGETQNFKVPLGAGAPVPIPLPASVGAFWPGFHPDGKRFLLRAWDPAKGMSISVWDPERKEQRRIWGPEQEDPTYRLSPSGKYMALGELSSGEIQVFPLGGGPRRTFKPFKEFRPIPVGWIDGDRAVLISEGRWDFPLRIHRLDLPTGRVSLWKSLDPGGRNARMNLPTAVMATRDGDAYAFGLIQDLVSDLYIIQCF